MRRGHGLGFPARPASCHCVHVYLKVGLILYRPRFLYRPCYLQY